MPASIAKQMKISQSAAIKYEWFKSLCRDDEPKPLTPSVFCANGVSAIEAFHVFESTGKKFETREPEILDKYIQGKAWHGVTVKNAAADYVDRLLFASELRQFPDWVRSEILNQAKKVSMATIGFVPKFVETGEDFTTLCPPQ